MGFVNWMFGFIIGNGTGAIAGAVLYWYFVVHRQKVVIPTGIKK